VLRIKSEYAAGQEKLARVARPYWLKARDGCMYLQMQLGSTVVYIRSGIYDASSRASSMSIAAYNKVTSFYLDPLVEKAVAIYQKLNNKIRSTLAPLAHELMGRFVFAKVTILGVVAQVRVRAVAARDAVSAFPSACYVKFKEGFVYVQAKVDNALVSIKVSLQDIAHIVSGKMSNIRVEAQTQLLALTNYARSTSAALNSKVRETVADQGVQVATAGAAAGAAALGASGGATGLVAGTAVGAACGVVPAIFTLGLSIPIGAALGGAAGMCMGTVAGGTVGLVGGGAAGRKAHKHRVEIQDGVSCALTKANDYKSFVAEKAGDYKSIVAEKANGCKSFVTEKAGDYKSIVAEKANGCKNLVAEKASDCKGYVSEKSEHVRVRFVGGTGGTA